MKHSTWYRVCYRRVETDPVPVHMDVSNGPIRAQRCRTAVRHEVCSYHPGQFAFGVPSKDSLAQIA